VKPLPPVYKTNKSLRRLNPAERRYAKRHTQEFLAGIVHEAAEHVYDTMVDPTMAPDLRLRAAFDILDRTMGKPVNRVETKVLDEMEERREIPDLESVPTDELEKVLQRLTDLTSGASHTDISSERPAVDDDFDFDG